jgi:hypothetical protein
MNQIQSRGLLITIYAYINNTSLVLGWHQIKIRPELQI